MAMNIKKIAFWVLCLAVALGCTPDKPTDEPQDIPLETYSRLNLLSGCGYNAATDDSEITRAVWDDEKGEGGLILKWESVDIDSDRTNMLSFVLADAEKPILGTTSPDPDAAEDGVSYSGLSVTPYEEDAYHAEFQTVNYYSASDLERAVRCYAVAGVTQITEDAEKGEHCCSMTMPSSFTQSASQDPTFLRDYMFMYATAAYKGERTMLNFSHIPATFRFVITNSAPYTISLQEVSLTLSGEEGGKVASNSAALTFDWHNGGADLQFGEDGYGKVSVAMGKGAALASDAAYTAYAMALPLADNKSFVGKTLNFIVKSDNEERVAFALDGAKLAEINGSEIYNWVGGKSYTIKIAIDENGNASGEILADNRIVVKSNSAATYTLVYEGAECQPLADYAPICTLSVEQLAYYEDFIDVNVAPRAARTIGIYDAEGVRQGTIRLAGWKPDSAEEPLYSFGVLSDVHIGRSVINPEGDFERALAHFNTKGAMMACICGDISQNGTEAEFEVYKGIVDKSAIPVYTTTGNHDCKSGGNPIDLDLWGQYTNMPLLFERTIPREGGVDHFLFLGMTRWNFTAPYLDSSLLWLEERLEAYRNDRCFVITHLFFPERAGNLNDIYPSGNWLRGAQLQVLQYLCDRYVNTVWFSGHSHWEWQLQKYQDRANIYRAHSDKTSTSGWCVHIPSCGVPITSDGTTRVDNTEGSEGALVQVYKNHIDILGVDLASGKYLPIATYRLDTSIQNVAENSGLQDTGYITAADFVVNQEKKGATVTDVADNYVEVTFTDKGQGFYVTNSTFTPNATRVNIMVEDVQAMSNGEIIDIPANVGFYGGDYYLTSTISAEIINNDKYQGVQFQTSKSKYGDGPLPLTLRIKFKMVFYE